MKSAAMFKTERASRHLAALCHHFGRKVEAECNEASGWVQFPFGRCDLLATPTCLEMHIAAESKEHIDTLAQVMTSHLERFAFRENPQLVWEDMPENTHSA